MTVDQMSPIEYARHLEKRRLKHLASRVGLALWLFLGCQFAMMTILAFVESFLIIGTDYSLLDQMGSMSAVSSIVWSMIAYILMLGIPLAVGLTGCRKDGIVPVTANRVPAVRAIALLFAGLGVCVFADCVASWSVEFWGVFGIWNPATESAQDGSAAALLLTLLSTAVLPAIMEELLFRGVILQSLRPSGDVNALVLSSVLFGLTHGTLAQIPFATIIGLACGYLVLKTGNLVLSMILHFLNNAIAVFLEFLTRDVPDAQAAAWLYLSFCVLAVLGLVGWLFLQLRAQESIAPLNDGVSSWLTRAERRQAAWLSPAILLFIGAMLLLTLLSAEPFLSAFEDLIWSFGGLSYG